MISTPDFAGPGSYRVVARGRMTQGLSDRFGSMRVVSSPSDDSPSVVVLEGRVKDQAELFGILNALYELRFTLISVNSLDEELPSPGG